MYLNPTWSGGDLLASVLLSPSLDEAHSDSAHLGQLVDRLEASIDRLGQQSGELLVVEYLQVATRRDLANSGWMPSITLVAVWRLNKNGRF